MRTDGFHSGAPDTDRGPSPRRSYRITPQEHAGAVSLGDFWLSSTPDLPLIPVHDQSGATAGYLLGTPIDLDRAALIKKTWTIPCDADLSTEEGALRALRSLGGSFVWICMIGQFARIYPDAGTQVPCVWDSYGSGAGVTAQTVLSEDDYIRRFDHQAFRHLATHYGGSFPAALTAHAGITRLLPNHYLDLKTWTAHRFDSSLQGDSSSTPDATVNGIIDLLQRQILAHTAGDKSITLGLSAGYSSRTLLAAARPWVQRLTCATFDRPAVKRKDVHLPSQIAIALDLQHHCLPLVEASRMEQEGYLRASGHCVGDERIRSHASLHGLAQDQTFLTGVGGAMLGRASFDAAEAVTLPLSAQALLASSGVQETDKSLRYVRLWLAGLQDDTPAAILAQFFQECILGLRISAAFSADPLSLRLAPFLTYPISAAFQALPDDWRNTNRVFREIITRLWPELDHYPYNLPIAAKRVRAQLRRQA